MKIIKQTLIITSLIALTLAFTGCSTLTTWIDSPQGQATITAIETSVVPIVTNLLSGLLPLTAASNATPAVPLAIDTPSVVTAQATAVAQLQAQFPTAPKSYLVTVVNQQFTKQLAKK